MNTRAFLTTNGPAKIVSVILAILLWLIISSGQERIGTFPGGIPITVLNTPENLVASLEVDEVEVSLVADRALWQRFGSDSFRASVDLASATAGVEDRFVTVQSLIPGVQITRVQPERMLVRLEPIEQKTVPVRTQFNGQAADGFAAGEIQLNPSEVTLQGPQSELERIDEALATIPLDGQRQNFEQTVAVRIERAGEPAQSVTAQPASVVATVPIVRAANTKTVGITVATSGSPPSRFAVSGLSVSPSVATISGSASALSQIAALQTVTIALGEFRETSQVTTQLVVPEGVHLVEPTETVSVSVQIFESETIRVIDVPVSTVDLADEFQVTSVSPALVQVRVRGSARILSNLTATDVAAPLSLRDITTAGAHTKTLGTTSIDAPNGVGIEAVQPDSVTVEVE